MQFFLLFVLLILCPKFGNGLIIKNKQSFRQYIKFLLCL